MSLIDTLTLNHELSGIKLEELVGYSCELIIVDTQGSADVTVLPVYASISKTKVRTYQRFSFAADNATVSDILNIISTAKIQIDIYAFGVSGIRYKISSDYKPLSDFRIDTGPLKQTITISSDSTVVDYSGGDFTVTAYSYKSQRNDSGGTFNYSVNPMLFKYFGINSVLTESGTLMTISSKLLVIKESSANLVVEAIQI